MNGQLLHGLILCGTDVDGALRRFRGGEALYTACLDGFLQDRMIEELARAVEEHAWDDAFTAARALKGLAGNMGFIPLFHAAGKLVVIIRAGKIGEVDGSYREVCACYRNICAAIRQSNRNCAYTRLFPPQQ